MWNRLQRLVSLNKQNLETDVMSVSVLILTKAVQMYCQNNGTLVLETIIDFFFYSTIVICRRTWDWLLANRISAAYLVLFSFKSCFSYREEHSNLQRLHASLDNRSEDGLTLISVCKHLWNLVQQATKHKRISVSTGQHVQDNPQTYLLTYQAFTQKAVFHANLY